MTSSIKWEPLEDIKVISGFVGKALGLRHGRDAQAGVGGPLTDLYETPEAFVAEIEVPGMGAEQVDISVYGSALTISIERPAVEGRDYLYQERATGKISRTLSLPAAVDVNQIQAHVLNGLLVLTMPKREDARQVKISVSA